MGKVWKSFLGKIQNQFSDFLPGIQSHVTVTHASTSQPYPLTSQHGRRCRVALPRPFAFTLKTTFLRLRFTFPQFPLDSQRMRSNFAFHIFLSCLLPFSFHIQSTPITNPSSACQQQGLLKLDTTSPSTHAPHGQQGEGRLTYRVVRKNQISDVWEVLSRLPEPQKEFSKCSRLCLSTDSVLLVNQ